MRAECRIPFRIVVAPFHRQAELFINDSIRDYGWERWQCKIVINVNQLRGLHLVAYEVWWLDRMWPCSTREDVERMEQFKIILKSRGARIRRWWT